MPFAFPGRMRTFPALRHRSRAGSSYPPDASTEMEYATAVSLRYSVGSLNGFSLSGTPDTGTFNPLLLQVDTPVIRFAIEPTEDDDACNTHSRQAFHDLVQLVGLTLYVDYPDNPSSCHDKDTQVPHGNKAHASLASPAASITQLLAGNWADVSGSRRKRRGTATFLSQVHGRGPYRPRNCATSGCCPLLLRVVGGRLQRPDCGWRLARSPPFLDSEAEMNDPFPPPLVWSPPRRLHVAHHRR